MTRVGKSEPIHQPSLEFGGNSLFTEKPVLSIQFRVVLWSVICTMTFTMVQNIASADDQQTIRLWKGVAPGSEKFTGQEEIVERGDEKQSNLWVTGVSEPTLTAVPATTKAPAQTAVVICPGGGYGGLSYEKEGAEIANWLSKFGITSFVLKYRHGGGVHKHPVPLSDVQRAMRVVRSLAKEMGFKSDQVGVMGFSAGGHLASSVGTHFDTGNKQSTDKIEQQSSRPDFLVLVYPVISMDARITHGGSLANLLGDKPSDDLVKLMSNDLHVTEQTPPTFIAHAGDDEAVPVANALRFYQALVDHHVPAELHVFEKGGHGFGMRQKGPIEEWPNLLAHWLKSRHLIE